MHSYETLFVLRPDLPEAHIRETIDRARRLIEGMEGTFGSVDEWGARALAYPIEKQSRGYYVLIEYTAKPEVVTELERTFRIADEVLRYVTVRQQQDTKTKERKSRRPQPPREEGVSDGEGEEMVDEQAEAEF